jgi:hypothetical protein
VLEAHLWVRFCTVRVSFSPTYLDANRISMQKPIGGGRRGGEMARFLQQGLGEKSYLEPNIQAMQWTYRGVGRSVHIWCLLVVLCTDL